MPETVTLSIADVVRDRRLQVRTRMNRGKVQEYARAMVAGVEFEPVTVADVKGVLYLTDGWHRVAALEANGEAEVTAEVHAMTWAEAQMAAFTANLKHGLPLKASEKREVFRRYMKAGLWRNAKGRPKSSREIAGDLSGIMTHTTVLNRIRADFPRLARHWTGEGPEGAAMGGLREAEGDTPDALEETRGRLREALALSRGVTCPEERGELLDELERLRQEVEAARPWTPVAF